MARDTKPKDSDACPQCGGAFVVDERQAPAVLIARKKRNAASPAVAERFAEAVRAKVADAGVIHRCVACGYRSRFAAATVAA